MEFILAACRLHLVEREKFKDLMEISLDRQQKLIKTENKKRGGGRLNLDNSVAEKTWQEMDLALGNVNQVSVKSESAENEIKEEIKVEIKTEIDLEENFQCGKCGKYLPSGTSLGIHMRKVHNESTVPGKRKKMFSCKFCTKSYPLKHQMSMHVKKQHSKRTQNTKTKTENGTKQKPDKDEMSETDEIQKCLMELSEDEDDGVEIKAEQNLKKVTKDKERKALPDEQNSTQSTKDIEINPMDANALPDNLNSKQIMMDVDKLFNASETVSKINVDKDEDISLRSKKGTVEQLLTQLRESKYFRSQKNQVFFECPFKEADTFVHLDLIPGWRSKVSKVWKRSFLEFD